MTGTAVEVSPSRQDPPTVPARDQYAIGQIAFLVAIHLGAVAVLWETNWTAIGVGFLLYAVFGGLGICVGYHRLLTHRSFKCPRAVEYTLALLGSFALEGKPSSN
ncbi:MAG: hypothetical protein ACRD3T_15205 [Terriglobia bacterium]